MLNEKYKKLKEIPGKAAELGEEILKVGYVVLDDFLDEQTKADFRQFVEARKNLGGKDDAHLRAPLHDFGYSDDILDFSQALYDARCTITGEPRKILLKKQQRVGVPYKDARDEKKTEETAYHYDGAYINIIIPLILPENQSRDGGGLTLFPNLRLRYPKIVSKVLSRFLRHSAMLRRFFGYTQVPYRLYAGHVFFGDLSFHGVEPIRSGERLVITINNHW